MGAVILAHSVNPSAMWAGLRFEWSRQAWWMLPNFGLAMAPAVGAGFLHRWRHRFGFFRWVPLAVTGLLLPNAPYVVTDLIHLKPAVAAAPSRVAVTAGVIPLFFVLVGSGILSFAYCIHVLRREMVDRGWSLRRRVAAEAVVDGLCAVGIVLGRVPRLNSWDVLQPWAILHGIWVVASDPRADVLALLIVVGSSVGVDWLAALWRGFSRGRHGGRMA